MNYIKLLNAAFEKFYFDDRLNPTHISLYMALFQEWNSSRFTDKFFVNRRDLMQVAKIGSKSTYHRCIRDLDIWGYLEYFPSNNPYKGSKIKMSIIGTTDEPEEDHCDPKLEQLAERYHPTREQVVNQQRPVSGQALVSTPNNTKPIKHNQHPKARQAVLNFFIENGFTADEGNKFFDYYECRDWQTSDGNQVRDWRALAIHWMERTKLFTKEKKSNKKRPFQNPDNLRTTKNKDYGQPL